MTAALASTVPAPPVRLRPVPASEPPYENPHRGRPADEPRPRSGSLDVELPLDWGQARRPTGRATNRPRSGRTSQQTASRPGPVGWRAMAEDPPLAIKRFVDMYVEVLNERRPLRHLIPYTSDEAFARIQLDLARRGVTWWPAGRGPLRRPQRPGGPGTGHPVPIHVQRLRSCAPRPGVVEVTALLRRAEEVRAVALRLEQEHRRWICTALEFVR